MCGIFGYIGSREAQPILLAGLRALEYRGYDSAGIFIPGFGTVKASGPIASLETKLTQEPSGTAGIAHTRWATHGAPTEVNAHPHQDASGKVWLVHNGIVENYRELRDVLAQRDITCTTDTDTEVLAKLIGYYYTGDLVSAARQALSLVRGTYGIAAMSTDMPHTLVVARLGSPIALGIGHNEHFVTSDPAALLPHTKDVVFLNDGDMAIVEKDRFYVQAKDGVRAERISEQIEWDVEQVQKGGFEHFMLKEIFEAPEVVINTTRSRLLMEEGRAKLGGLESILPELARLDRLEIVGCGSAYYAGVVGRYLLETYAHIPVDIELASEYRYRTHVRGAGSALLAVSQSGETADTLASVRDAARRGMCTLGIINAIGSTIARETDAGVYNHAGPEIAVASTKAFISQLTVFVLLTLLIGRERGMSHQVGQEIVTALDSLPHVLRTLCGQSEYIQRLAEKYATHNDMIFIGRNTHAPIAYEGALKLKEVAYVHAEAYAGGELKHGPIAMLNESFPVLALVPKDALYEKMISNIAEVCARQAPVLAIATEGDEHITQLANDVIFMPHVHPIIQPIVSAMPLHLFAYYAGIARGYNVDRPRNLAKSVTVE